MKTDLFESAKACLQEDDVDRKIQRSINTVRSCKIGFELNINDAGRCVKIGRPLKPTLVSPQILPKRGFATRQSRMALVHAIAHIEFNAINLAWDAIYHFQQMPEDYYVDWLRVAEDETRHFVLLRTHLNKHAYDYGDFDAHDSLWKMAGLTVDDVLHRMAVVPRVLEARGLDVTPAMINKFTSVNEFKIAETLKIIYREEIEHVRIGNKWFRHVCEQRGLDAENTFIKLIRQYHLDGIRGSINREARKEAGFSERELNFLQPGKAKI